ARARGAARPAATAAARMRPTPAARAARTTKLSPRDALFDLHCEQAATRRRNGYSPPSGRRSNQEGVKQDAARRRRNGRTAERQSRRRLGLERGYDKAAEVDC